MEEIKKEMENELAELKKELAMCEKEIAKRNDKQKDYLLEKLDILSDIASVQEELELLENLPTQEQTQEKPKEEPIQEEPKENTNQ
jgi:hypothetical protein